MKPEERIRIIDDCQAALHATGWTMGCLRVWAEGERRWQVQARRGEHTVVFTAQTVTLAWIGALQQTRCIEH